MVDTPVQTDPAPEPESPEVEEAKEASDDAGADLEEGIMRLLQLLYFAQVLEKESMLNSLQCREPLADSAV